MKILKKAEFDDRMTSTIVAFLNDKGVLGTLLLKGLEENLTCRDNIFVDVMKSGISQFDSEKQKKMLNYLIDNTRYSLKLEDLDGAL